MFEDLEIIKGDKRDKKRYSFVGIQRDEQTKKLEFWLPHGFGHFPDNNFNSKKKLFFSMYKTFRKFLRFLNEHPDFFKKSEIKKVKREGVITDSKGGFVFTNNDGEEIILYSKLNMIDSILDGYDELKIMALLNKHTRSEIIDYSKIDKYMHKAIYVQNDVIYIDEMMIPRKVIEYSNTDLIDMYCFIYLDIKESLEEDNDIPHQVKALAQNFKEKYLTPTSSLFEEETSQRTINTLKEVLAEIDRNSAYKDDDYWHFFDAIEAFLYGTYGDDSSGNYWGINKFSCIWETMCHHYMFKNFKDEILYADSEDHANIEIAGHKVYLKKDFENPFFFQFNDDNSKVRYVRPDIVYKSSNNESIIDNIFKEIKIIGHNFGGIEISIESLISVKSKLKQYDCKEEGDFMSNQIKGKQIRVGGKRNQNTITITKKNYETILSQIKRRIQDRQESFHDYEMFFMILDYKYEPIFKFEKDFHELAMQIDTKSMNKIKTDIKKQLIYEYALQLQNESVETNSRFFIPYYFDDKNSKEIGIGISHDKHGKEIKESRIEIFKANFMLIQEIYNNDN